MKILRILPALLFIVAICGCIKVDQTVTIKKDGSGVMDLSYSMNEKTIQQMNAMSDTQPDQTGSDQEEQPFDFDAASVKEQLADFKDQGIDVKSVKTETKDGWKTMNVKLAFDDLESLAKTEFFKDNSVVLTKNKDGNYLFKQQAKSADSEVDMGMREDPDPAMLKQMAPVFAGMSINHRIKVPGKIISSNATEVDGNTASWVFDVDKDPEVLSKIMNLDMQIEFEGQGLDLPDVRL